MTQPLLLAGSHTPLFYHYPSVSMQITTRLFQQEPRSEEMFPLNVAVMSARSSGSDVLWHCVDATRGIKQNAAPREKSRKPWRLSLGICWCLRAEWRQTRLYVTHCEGIFLLWKNCSGDIPTWVLGWSNREMMKTNSVMLILFNFDLLFQRYVCACKCFLGSTRFDSTGQSSAAGISISIATGRSAWRIVVNWWPLVLGCAPLFQLYLWQQNQIFWMRRQNVFSFVSGNKTGYFLRDVLTCVSIKSYSHHWEVIVRYQM